MKKNHITITFIAFLVSAIAYAQESNVDLLRKVEGFSHPESVIYDEVNDLLYVSNIGESDTRDGFISKVSVDGEILELNWITGLKDPKGLLLLDGILYVTDVTSLIMMDIQAGKINTSVPVEGSRSLNDITADEDGNIFISDLANNSIYKRDVSGEIRQWMNTEDLEKPNGVLAVNDKLFVAGWGQDQNGNLLKVDMNNKIIENITLTGIGNLDGIQMISASEFYVSDWATGRILKMDTKGNTKEILTSAKSSGDFLFLKHKSELVLPMNLQNAVWWYKIN